MYYIDLVIDGISSRFGPIVNDNPKRATFTDERIKRKAEFWASRLDKMDGVTARVFIRRAR